MGRAIGGSRLEGLYRGFHGAVPKGEREVEVPTPKGKLMKIGRLVEITYEPEEPSQRKRTHYVHEFGDDGNRVVKGIKSKPILATDKRGDLFIVRDKSRHYFSPRGIIG